MTNLINHNWIVLDNKSDILKETPSFFKNEYHSQNVKITDEDFNSHVYDIEILKLSRKQFTCREWAITLNEVFAV